MLVPLSWLKEYVNIDQSPAEVADLLTNAGLEVKTIAYIGIPGADLVWDREKIILGQILQVEQHPDADKLVLATVAYGGEQPEVVVTGAPNLFPFVGQGDIRGRDLFSPLALEGATLYDGHKEGRKKTVLKGKPLRGIFNRCMLCSEKELGISEEHEGIILMVKDENSPVYQPGTPVQDLLGDAVLEIDVIPNIARCASMVGVAREYAALTNQPIQYPSYEVVMEGPGSGQERVTISTDEPELNPRFVAIVIEGVEQKPSPHWLQHRLRLAGQRPINVVVDVSNYVMLEMGQPNHTFDYDYLRQRADQYAPNGPIHIHTRLPRKGETLTTLDGTERSLLPYTILVTDAVGNLGLGGIMGGENSEIKPETKNVLLEAAAWNFINIRKSSTRLGLFTEASFRFSRGVHPSQALLGAKRGAELLRRLAGGRVVPGIIDYYPNPPQPVTVKLDLDYARRLSGLDLTGREMADLLQRLAFKADLHTDHLLVTVPDYRLDIEGGHDLVEEICRLYRYEEIPLTVLADTLPPQRGNHKLELEEQIKDALVQMGLQEVITYRLSSAGHEARLLPNSPPDDRPYVALTNPISPERSVMRHSLLASVLEVAAANSRYQSRIPLFEIGPIYLADEDAVLPTELARLALVLTGERVVRTWQQNQPELYDFFDLKGVLDGLWADLGLTVTVEPAVHPSFRRGRTARLLLGETQIGLMGELHPLVVEKLDLRVEKNQPVLAADIDLEAIYHRVPPARPYTSIPAYPAVREDLALVVRQDVAAAAVEQEIRKAGGYLLRQVELFDLFIGGNLPPGHRSLAYHLTYQANDKTLTDKDARKIRQRIIAQLERNLGAKLRE
ncbi:MAG: phenylalanine--tRNA ligase subunit beta [Anaerolineae bacterium]|nr:phenylalanine--tRNA ligase subunit beta [Anaerolineae bacterium]